MNKQELIEKIKSAIFDAPGSSGKGRIYHEIPFEGYEEVSVARETNEKRLDQLMTQYNFKGKKVLDIGCSVGYFSFKLATQGAECWGIDLDSNSIAVANSLKEIHGVNNVHFLNDQLTSVSIKKLLEESGGFDVILLFSVIHWLLKANRSEKNVINLLKQLIKDKQVIFYEPAISDKSYYPEILESGHVYSFLNKIGYDEIKNIGGNFASNIKGSRDLYMGGIDFEKIVKKLSGVNRSTPRENFPKEFVHLHKEIFSYGRYVIKFNDYPKFKGANSFLFENEALWLEKLQGYDFIPKYFGKYELNGQIYLVMEKIEGVSLDKASWIMDKNFDRYFPKLIDKLHSVLEVFEKKGIVHKDLRPHNIIINKDMTIFKIIDFQFCSKVGEKIKTTSDDQEEFCNSCLENVGGEWRKPDFAEFDFSADKYAINKILNSLSPQKRKKVVKRSLLVRLALGIKTYIYGK